MLDRSNAKGAKSECAQKHELENYDWRQEQIPNLAPSK